MADYPRRKIIALVPARAGSQRIPGKNSKLLHGHPLIAYTLAAAQQSGIFTRIVVSTDSKPIADIAKSMQVETISRPLHYATNASPDVEWVHDALRVQGYGYSADCFAILRPTSPFRSAATIQRAWAEFERSDFECLRAVSPVTEHPWKMWIESNCELTPLMWQSDSPPWHSRPTQSLPRVMVQNASLEMAKCSLIMDRLYPSICSGRIWAFHAERPDTFDLNTPEDWAFAEMQIAHGVWRLPTV